MVRHPDPISGTVILAAGAGKRAAEAIHADLEKDKAEAVGTA